MRVKTFVSNSVNEIDKVVNEWLKKNNNKIKLHDIKVQAISGRVIYVLIFDHYAIEEIED